MASQDAYNAAMGAFSMYGSLLKDVAAEIGMDRALNLHADQGRKFGQMLVEMLEERRGDSDLNIHALASVFSEVGEGFGLDPEVEFTPDQVTFTHHVCPIYQGFKMAGWTHDEIKAACEGMGAEEVSTIQETFPRLSACITFRSTPEAPCVEEYSLNA